MKITGHFLPIYNEDFLKGVKKIKILVDHAARDKIVRACESLAGVGCKIPITNHGSDLLLNISVPAVAKYTSDGLASSLAELLGNEVNVEIKLQKYTIVSKYERNKGEKITGTKIGLIGMSM